ncbi:RiPP maturation radical SAM C-methyltransferase [Geodermatophilus sp. URMC 64]
MSMPTMSTRFPSFQLALLTPVLERAGYEVRPMSLFLRFAERLGPELNEALADVYPCMVGEWIWSTAAFGPRDDADEYDADEYMAHYGSNLAAICQRAGCTVADLRHVRDVVAVEWLEEVVENVDWSAFSMVGLSVTFQQMVASLALARALKRRHPELPVVLGGATFEDDIAGEVMARNPAVDLVHCGDADVSLPELVRRLTAGEPMTGLRGVMWRDEDGAVRYEGRAPNFADLDSSPVPDFDEYFATRPHGDRREVMLPIETARGCWYGMKHHCVFCGLNRAGMEFRRKSPEQVLDMLQRLSGRYGTRWFNAIDNILAPAYMARLFGRLAEEHSDLRLHYEIRPKINRTQLRELRRGGLVSVQPGIESFSTHVLTLMRKNVTGMGNLELLKWTTYYGINNSYNILYGFPGETEADYRMQAEIIRRIPHLQPPYAMAQARPDRGSPMHEEPGGHAISFLRPSACYRFIYPPDYDLRRIAYFFEHGFTRDLPVDGPRECRSLVSAWKSRWSSGRRPYLRYVKTWRSVSIHDGRGAEPRGHRYDGDAAALYELCADARTREELLAATEYDGPSLDQALAEFTDRDLVLCVDDRYLALALPENPYH